MKSISILMLAALFFALIPVGSLDAHAQDNVDNAERQWGPVTGGARLSISTDRDKYRVGEPIKLEIIRENVGEETLAIYRSLPILAFGIDARLPNGAPAPLTLAGEEQPHGFISRSIRLLEPGESDSTDIPILNRYFDLTLKGEYSITVSSRVGPFDGGIRVTSNTLTILIEDIVADEVEGKEPAEWGEAAHGIRLAIVLDHESYSFDQPIKLRMIVKNTGERAVRLPRILDDADNLMMARRLDIRFVDRTPAPLTLEGQRLSGRRSPFYARRIVTLQPGDSKSYIVPALNRLYDMTKVGDYTVTVHLDIRPEGEDEEWVEVQSNTIRIRVEH